MKNNLIIKIIIFIYEFKYKIYICKKFNYIK